MLTLKKDNHINHVVEMLDVPEAMVKTVAEKEKLKLYYKHKKRPVFHLSCKINCFLN